MENNENRDRILECAVLLFACRGYEAVSVNEIVEKAGITKPTMYYYFGSKYGVLEEIIKHKGNAMLRQVEKAAEYSGDVPLTLYRLARAYFSFGKNEPDFCRMQLSMIMSYPESEPYRAVRPMFEREIGILENLFLAAAADHGNMKGRHKAYAATFLGMLNTYTNLQLSGELDISEEVTFKAVHQFMHGIFS